ncbi:MAG TPA: MFS transporter [Kiloniellales bacterium]|nr:MFS transporter [Kiloniellales bacterium]
MSTISRARQQDESGPDSYYAWWRLLISLLIATIGGAGLWSAVIVLPTIEAEFAVARGGASLPYAATMIGFAVGGLFMGWAVDRFGILRPLAFGSLMLAIGYVAISFVGAYWQFVVIQAVMIGMLGSAVTFGPLIADVTHWFLKRRGIATAIVASGSYLAGTVWPPLLNHVTQTHGWREAHLVMGLICLAILPLLLLLRRPTPIHQGATPVSTRPAVKAPLPLPALQALLAFAGIACCIAMAMPQVHIVAYCIDLGHGAARGAEMLSLMLGLGIVSRLISGVIADYIGGLGTLLLGSALQCMALLFYLPFDGLVSLYIVSAIFGLSQGGIVPSYALIVREYFPAREAGARVSLVLMATIVGMALGGWLSGVIYDWTGSYQVAFWNGIAWNLVNTAIALFLLFHRWKQDIPVTARG